MKYILIILLLFSPIYSQDSTVFDINTNILFVDVGDSTYMTNEEIRLREIANKALEKKEIFTENDIIVAGILVAGYFLIKTFINKTGE